MEVAMEFTARFFILLFTDELRRNWYVGFFPIAVMIVHGLYTGSWYVWTAIIAAAVLTVVVGTVIALSNMK